MRGNGQCIACSSRNITAMHAAELRSSLKLLIQGHSRNSKDSASLFDLLPPCFGVFKRLVSNVNSPSVTFLPQKTDLLMQICIWQHMINQSPVGIKGLAQQLFAATQQGCPGRRVFVPQKGCLWGAAEAMRCRRPGEAATRGKRAWRRGRRRLFARGPSPPPHTPSASPPAAVAAKAMRTVGPNYSKHANNQNQNRTGHHDSSRY